MEKTVEYYLGLPYTIELVPEPEGGWFVGVKELPGCISEGDTPEEAIEMIRDAMRAWIEVALEDGDPVPEPRQIEAYSGKFLVRVPRSLHRDLVAVAEQENVSLNQYISTALARAVGQSTASRSSGDADRAWPGFTAGLRKDWSLARKE
jgi:antitoxin HicB